jgi:hypothetical protein
VPLPRASVPGRELKGGTSVSWRRSRGSFLVQLSLVGVGTGRFVWSALGTLLGPEGSGFGLTFSDVGPFHRVVVGAWSCGLALGRTARVHRLVGVGAGGRWESVPPVP